MPIFTILPRGCSSTRGASHLSRGISGGGARHANRFYMLNVQRESLQNKKVSLESRLTNITEQLKRTDAEIQTILSDYGTSVSPTGKVPRKIGRGTELKY